MVRNAVELTAHLMEILAVAIIVASLAQTTVRYAVNVRRQVADAYKQYRLDVGKALLLGLELLVAADVVETVVLERTLDNFVMLALLVLLRTFLSWSVLVEIEGRWPWRPRVTEAGDGRSGDGRRVA